MVYIIKTQQNRTVGEITFDHCHERVTEAIRRSDPIKYRRREKQLIYFFYGITFLVVPSIELAGFAF